MAWNYFFLIAIFVFVTGYQSLSATTQASSTPVVLIGSTNTVTVPLKTIVGLWERRSSETTERFSLQSDGTYTIEARDTIQSMCLQVIMERLLTMKAISIMSTKDSVQGTESYYLDNGDLLVINNQVERAWTRVR